MNPSPHVTDLTGQAPNADPKKTIYAVGAPHCAPPSAQWFAEQRGHRLTIFPQLADCQQALLRPAWVQLIAILVGAQVDEVVDFVYQLRSESGHAETQLLLLVDEGRLIELMPLLRGVAGVDFAAPASSPEFLQQRVAHLLTQPVARSAEQNNPIRVQIVDSVMSRLINSRRRSKMELSRFQQLLSLVAGPVMLFESNTLDCVYANPTAMAMIAPNASPAQAAINLTTLVSTPGRETVGTVVELGFRSAGFG